MARVKTNEVDTIPSGARIRAWVVYNSNTRTIISSYNVSSVTAWSGVGHDTVHFTNAFSDNNYAVAGAGTHTGGGNSNHDISVQSRGFTACNLLIMNLGGSAASPVGHVVHVVFIGNE